MKATCRRRLCLDLDDAHDDDDKTAAADDADADKG
jgi:hypothetical protein